MLDENQKYAVCRYALISYFAKNVGNEESKAPIKLNADDFAPCMEFIKRNYQAYINSKDLNYRKEI